MGGADKITVSTNQPAGVDAQIYVGISWTGSATVKSVTDTAGNKYTVAGPCIPQAWATSGFSPRAIYTATVSNSGTNKVTATFTGPVTGKVMHVFESVS